EQHRTEKPEAAQAGEHDRGHARLPRSSQRKQGHFLAVACAAGSGQLEVVADKDLSPSSGGPAIEIVTGPFTGGTYRAGRYGRRLLSTRNRREIATQSNAAASPQKPIPTMPRSSSYACRYSCGSINSSMRKGRYQPRANGGVSPTWTL